MGSIPTASTISNSCAHLPAVDDVPPRPSDASTEELHAEPTPAPAPVAGLWADACPLPRGDGVMALLLAADAVALVNGFRAAWHALRGALTGLPPARSRQSGSL